MFVIVSKFDLYLLMMYSIPMTTKVVSSITTPYEIYSIPIKTDHEITEIIMK
jgi:hypothetical protein